MIHDPQELQLTSVNYWKKSPEIRSSVMYSPNNQISHTRGDDQKADIRVRLDITTPYNGSLQGSDAAPYNGAVSDKRTSPFEPQVETAGIRESTSRSVSSCFPGYGDSAPLGALQAIKVNSDQKAAPEKKLTLFALRLALLEKAASGLGTLGFIWATVVLLGGFAITLERTDFWFVTIILLIEGTRIFSRSHELEWQHETPLSMTTFRKDATNVRRSTINLRTILTAFCRPFSALKKTLLICKKTRQRNIKEENYGSLSSNVGEKSRNQLKRTWSSSNVQLLPYTGWLSISKNVSRLLFWLQLLAASMCVGLSLCRLAKQDYGVVSGSEKKNRRSALNIFYGLSLAEALLFLFEKAYWQWKITAGKLLVEVNMECGFDQSGLHTIRRFFYDTYSQSVNGSIFDGLKMDLVSFVICLLQSSVSHEQLTGARMLSAFVNNDRFAEDTLRKIGTMENVVERLLEMLNWKNHHEQEIRKAAAEIISKLVRKNRNCLRVAGIAGSLESIASLLYDAKEYDSQRTSDESHINRHIFEDQSYDYSTFSLFGLHILKNLAKDHYNCDKIGSTKDLLPKIIGFTEAKYLLTRNINAADSAQIKTVKRSLQLLKMLASTTSLTGKVLRKEISEIVFTISNLRDILQYGESHVTLQKLAVDILTGLALEEDARQSIGTTGSVLRSLFLIFLKERNDGKENERKLVSQAGKALALLALENKYNCQRIIHLKTDRSNKRNMIRNLIAVLNDPVQGVHAARILRNLCAYSKADYAELREVTAAASHVVGLVMTAQGKYQEAAIGLAAQIFKFLDRSEFDLLFEEAGITKRSLAKLVVEVLQTHSSPSNKVPGIRRFSIELAICMMQKDEGCFSMERLELEMALEGVMETTSEMESYSTFSGSVGLSRHGITIYSLVESTMDLLHPERHTNY
eukprot:Gb_17549 [translate_table: standard]